LVDAGPAGIMDGLADRSASLTTKVFDVEGQWRLAEQAIIHLQGPDAAGFLHGQLSNAVEGMPQDTARPAGYCTAQGRLLANGVVWRSGDETLDFMVSRDLVPGLLRRLQMFVLRSKVRLSLDEARDVQGVAGASRVPAALHGLPAWSRRAVDGADWIVAPQSTLRLPAAWRIRSGDPAAATVSPASDESGSAAWDAARLDSGWPWIRAASQDVFLPSALDMDLNGGIDFRKGCYPGQEVIARSHYRGTVKRRLALGAAAWPRDIPAPGAGSDLYAAGGDSARPTGRIIEAAIWQDRLHVAAEITLSDWPAMRYAVGAPDGPALALRPASAADAPAA